MRVRLVPLVCLAGLFCLPVFANETRTAATDRGSSFRGGPSHPGVYSSPPLRRLGGVAWKFQTEGPVRSSPTVTGGVVFVGSGDHRLYALDEETGSEIWRFETGGAVEKVLR
jgi:outer membrane protein assembly factor BamB